MNQGNSLGWLLVKDKQLKEKKGITYQCQQLSRWTGPLESPASFKASSVGGRRESIVTSGENRGVSEKELDSTTFQ